MIRGLKYCKYVITIIIILLLAVILYVVSSYFRHQSITATYGSWSGWTMEYYEEGSKEFRVYPGSKIIIKNLPSLGLEAKVLSVKEDEVLIETSYEMIRYDEIEGEEIRIESTRHTIRRGEELSLITPSLDVVVNYQFYYE